MRKQLTMRGSSHILKEFHGRRKEKGRRRREGSLKKGIGLRFGATGSVGVGNVSHLASLHYNALPISHCHWLECSVSLPMGFFHHGCQYSLSLIFSIYHVTLDPCCVEISY